MLNIPLLRPQLAQFHFDVMGYLIQAFGSPPPLFHSSPSQGLRQLENSAWTEGDPRSVFDWANDTFEVIISMCQMNPAELCLVADDGTFDAQQASGQQRIQTLASGQNPYFRPTMTSILYDPRDCSVPGHFAGTLILQLAELRAAGYKPPPSLAPRMVTLIAAAYNGQGFALAQLPRQVSAYLTTPQRKRSVPQRTGHRALCFASCLALRAQRRSEAEIIEAYQASNAQAMSKSLRRTIQRACRQIDSKGDALKTLQNLSSRAPLRA